MSFENDQRISAYLLGELSADEETQFENEMNQNPALKKAVDEQKMFFVSLKSELKFKSEVQLDQKHRVAINQKLYDGKIPFWKTLLTPKVGFGFASLAVLAIAISMIMPKLAQENSAPEMVTTVMQPPPSASAEGADEVAATSPQENVAPEAVATTAPESASAAAPEMMALQAPPPSHTPPAPMAKKQAIRQKSAKPVGPIYAIEYGRGIEKNISAPENIDLLLIDCLQKNHKPKLPKRINLKFNFSFGKGGKFLSMKSLNKDKRFNALAVCAVKTVNKKVWATQKKPGTFTYPITFVVK